MYSNDEARQQGIFFAPLRFIFGLPIDSILGIPIINSIAPTQPQGARVGSGGGQVIALSPTADQRWCRVNRCAVDVSPGIERMGADDGATQQATLASTALKHIDAFNVARWVLCPARSTRTGAKSARAKYQMRRRLPRTSKVMPVGIPAQPFERVAKPQPCVQGSGL